MPHAVPSLGDLSAPVHHTHHARTTSEPMWSTGLSWSGKPREPGKPGNPRPALRIITDLPSDPTTHRPPNPRYHRATKTAPLLTSFSVVHLGELREDVEVRSSLVARRNRREVAVFAFAPVGGDENTAKRGVPRLSQKPGWSEGAKGIEVEGVHPSGGVGTGGEVQMVGEKGSVGEVVTLEEAPSGRKRFKLHRRTISDKFKSLLVFHRESRAGTSAIAPAQDAQDEQDEHADDQAHRDASSGLPVEVILPTRPYRSPGTASFMVSRPGPDPDPPLSSRREHGSLAVTVERETSVSDCSSDYSHSSGTCTPSDTATVLAATTHRATRSRCGSNPDPDWT